MGLKKPVVLVILDGFGYRQSKQYNAAAAAHMHNFESWLQHYGHALLEASGTAVGLPEGTPGNSQVGHFTLGAGRIIKQPITLLNESIDDGSFFKNEMLLRRLHELKQSGGTLQLMGLLSDGASHSHEKHLYALLRLAQQVGLQRVVVHVFLDGRDVPPQSAAVYLERLDQALKTYGGVLGSIQGRAYAMDRSEDKATIERSFALLTQPQPIEYTSWRAALDAYYKQTIVDELIPPTQLIQGSEIKAGDGLIFFNIRADRARELASLFEQDKKLLWFITGIPYGQGFTREALITPERPAHTLLDELELAHKKCFVIAEHEKYAHVTYFFNGGSEAVHAHESRIIIPSLQPEKLIQHPEMSAPEITEMVLRSLLKHPRDFYLINYANPDMIGHTGNFDAAVKAMQCIDIQLKRLYDVVVEKQLGTLYIVADHGKVEEMYDTSAHDVRKAHTTNPVYFLMLQKNLAQPHGSLLPLHTLADVAPFILKEMHIAVPAEMQQEATAPQTEQVVHTGS